METKQNIRPLVSVGSIEPGELFLHGGDLFLKIHSSVEKSTQAVNLTTNRVWTWTIDGKVHPLKHEPLVWGLA